MEALMFPCFVKTAAEPARPPKDSPDGPAEDSQALLATRILKGDAAAEEELVGLFQRRVLAMMLSRVRDPEAARDLTQEVMMAVVLALRKGQIRDGKKLAAFVYGTARNFVKGHYRSMPPETLPLSPDLATADAGDILENLHYATLLSRILSSLDAMDRRILSLIFVEGLKPGEIARRLGLCSDVVRARKSRAIKRAIACWKRQTA
jgi:RNA polymerase sigma-70 factor (ECF subfamily)